LKSFAHTLAAASGEGTRNKHILCTTYNKSEYSDLAERIQTHAEIDRKWREREEGSGKTNGR
jgi:hypothetical protein